MTDSNDDPPFASPNAGAYEREELRVGPPLRYTAEKLRASLEAQNDVICALRDRLPDDVSAVAPLRPGVNLKADLLVFPAHTAFWNALVAHLALNNLTALATRETMERLLAFSREELRDWFRRIDEAGSTSG
jgi:hypothetical protein